MPSPAMKVLAINSGSSSIKFALFDASATLQRRFAGTIERIGLAGSRLSIEGREEGSQPVNVPDHETAVAALIERLDTHGVLTSIDAVGHRVVHGGPDHVSPQRITAELIAELRRLGPFNPDHLPAEISLIEAIQRHLPDASQVACFDTAFHRDMPRVAKLLSIPRHFEARGVRRYGFHGLSYAFLMKALNDDAGPHSARGRVILAHLGNGASLAAVRDGKPMDTTMSFTPTSGIPMGTRSGDLDPGLMTFLARNDGLDSDEFRAMINAQSGLLGVSETSADVRDLLEREEHDVRAEEALALFCYEIKKRIGAFTAVLNGLDTLVFSGGIGEHSASVRARVCDGLGALGIELDARRNAEHASLISTDTSRVAVHVIATNEEQMIGETVLDVLTSES